MSMSLAEVDTTTLEEGNGGTSEQRPEAHSAGGLGAGSGAFSTFFRQMENEGEEDVEKGCHTGARFGLCHDPDDMHDFYMITRRMEDFDQGTDVSQQMSPVYYDSWTPDNSELPLNHSSHLISAVGTLPSALEDSPLHPVVESMPYLNAGFEIATCDYSPFALPFDDEEDPDSCEKELLRRFHQMRILEQQQAINSSSHLYPGNVLLDDNLLLSLNQMDNSLHFEVRPRKVPKVIGQRYMLGTRIGNGSYGKVKDCIDIITLKRYAVKLMSHHIVRRIPNGFRNIAREIQLMRKLPRHRNVVRWITDFHDPNAKRDCLVMEYCLGSIHDLQASGLNDSQCFRRLPEWQTYKYFVQLIDGVEFLHGQRIIHQDLKPGNLLLNAQECVKITDFGVSEELSVYTDSDMIRFCQTTPAIQPPEVASGSAKVFSGFKLDYYCCGICLYFMLTGRVPFTTSSMLRIFEVIAEGRYEIPTFVSLNASDLIRKLLERDPEKRFDIPAMRAHSWMRRPPARIGKPLPLEYLFRNYGLIEETSCQGALINPDWGGPPHYHEGSALPPSLSEPLHLSCGISCEDKLEHTSSTPTELTPTYYQQSDKSLEEIRRLRNPLTCISRLRIKYNWPPPCADNEKKDAHILVGEDITHMALDESLNRIRPIMNLPLTEDPGVSSSLSPRSLNRSDPPSWSPFIYEPSPLPAPEQPQSHNMFAVPKLTSNVELSHCPSERFHSAITQSHTTDSGRNSTVIAHSSAPLSSSSSPTHGRHRTRHRKGRVCSVM